MPSRGSQFAAPRWYFIPVRVTLLSFLLGLISFAIGLLLGIIGILISSRIHSIHPNMSLAYRHVALPVAAITASIALVVLTVFEIRNYRQTKTLAEIARASR
jgi:spore maturation protein SpmA